MSDRGYRRLSAAVVIEAVQDAAGVRLSVTGNHSPRRKEAKYRLDARAFIESDRLDFWCSVVDLDPDAIRDRLPTQQPRVTEIVLGCKISKQLLFAPLNLFNHLIQRNPPFACLLSRLP